MNAVSFIPQPATQPPDNGWCVCIWVSIGKWSIFSTHATEGIAELVRDACLRVYEPGLARHVVREDAVRGRVG